MSELLKKYDAIVIGSGASGAVMAYELANKGLKVLIVEKGKHNGTAGFQHDELKMYAKLYKMAGLQTTSDNDVTIAQGQTVGGSTVINNAIWIRSNLDKTIPMWAACGAVVDKAAITKAYDYLENKLLIETIDEAIANKASNAFLKGCHKLGIPANYLQHNRHKCLGCGWCNYACKYNRKTSMLVTFIPWALQKGAHIVAGVEHTSITYKNGVCNGVSFMYEGKPMLIASDKVIVCAGAIGSSEILLQSRINPTGNVGQGLHLLGGLLVTAEMDQRYEAFDGIGLTCIAHASEDYLIENFHSPPGVFSITLSPWFSEHHELMKKYPFLIQAGVMTATEPRGKITLDKKNRAKIELKYTSEELEKLKKGIEQLGKIFFAAGAKKVIPAAFKPMVFQNESELSKVSSLIKKNDDIILGSAHPQGGNAMSDDPRRGAVNSQFEVHGMKNLFIADTSVWPTNIWANCQATAMAMSKYASTLIV
jgi:choline dehydrogenase-like flavoprotein